MNFFQKTSKDYAKELKKLREKRLKAEGRAKLRKQIDDEKKRIAKAKGSGGFGKFIENVSREAEYLSKATKKTGPKKKNPLDW